MAKIDFIMKLSSKINADMIKTYYIIYTYLHPEKSITPLDNPLISPSSRLHGNYGSAN